MHGGVHLVIIFLGVKKEGAYGNQNSNSGN